MHRQNIIPDIHRESSYAFHIRRSRIYRDSYFEQCETDCKMLLSLQSLIFRNQSTIDFTFMKSKGNLGIARFPYPVKPNVQFGLLPYIPIDASPYIFIGIRSMCNDLLIHWLVNDYLRKNGSNSLLIENLSYRANLLPLFPFEKMDDHSLDNDERDTDEEKFRYLHTSLIGCNESENFVFPIPTRFLQELK